MRYLLLLLSVFILTGNALAAGEFPMPNTTDQYGKPLTKSSLFYKDKKYIVGVTMSREGMNRGKEVVKSLQDAGINDKANILIFSNMSGAPAFIEGMVKGSFQWPGAPQAWLDWSGKLSAWAVPAKNKSVWIYLIDNAGMVILKIDATSSVDTNELKGMMN